MSSTKGWVYVITNKAMPGFVKVGFSTKDPKLRALELSTGSPYPHLVEFEFLIENPRDVEQRAHKALKAHRAGGEWFKCSVHQAIAAIQNASPTPGLWQRTTFSVSSPSRPPELQNRPPPPYSAATSQNRPAGTYTGSCSHCRSHITVTLSMRGDEARCPECYRQTSIGGFKRQDLVL